MGFITLIKQLVVDNLKNLKMKQYHINKNSDAGVNQKLTEYSKQTQLLSVIIRFEC